MNGTPRLKSAYPATPRNERRDVTSRTRPQAASAVDNGENDAPLIPLTILDAPSQRGCAFGAWVCLLTWRLWDYYGLISDDNESYWLFLKWVAIDFAFCYGIPELRIPWLRWSPVTVMALLFLHTFFSAVLMFRIPIPFEAWMMGFTRMIYDRELAVSERRVKPGSILHNSSLILGKQIVNILPEGSAVLNPDKFSFCLDASRTSVELPIHINQTTPRGMEIVRINLKTNTNETITISAKEIRRMKSKAEREAGRLLASEPRILKYPVKQTGVYRLQRVTDESNLEIQRRSPDTAVVPCPAASIRLVDTNRCRGDLSNFDLDVYGTPPLRVRYGKKVNQGKRSEVTMTVNPEEFDNEESLHALVSTRSHNDVSWAQSRHVKVPVNETMDVGGHWEYFVAEVKDALNNSVRYKLEDDAVVKSPKQAAPTQAFKVHDVPTVKLNGCSQQQPLKKARGEFTELPIWLNPTNQRRPEKLKHTLTYMYTPQISDDMNPEDAVVSIETVTMNSPEHRPEVASPGLYTLTGISSDFCAGEILEPSSCLLLNPPEPEVSISTEPIPHQCAGNSVGLRVNLELVGTPPFHISWKEQRNGQKPRELGETIDSLRTQWEFKPTEPGNYKYEFVKISDRVYQNLPLSGAGRIFEQSVRPTAWARFDDKRSKDLACIGVPASFDVHLSGEGPWTLEYDIVHAGKRKKHRIPDIKTPTHKLETPPLTKGGEHTITLTSITDSSGCKIFLEQEARVNVRHETPTAAFGLIDNAYSILVAGGNKKEHLLPLKLTGEGPWHITYTNINDGKSIIQKVGQANGALKVIPEGTYHITEIRDKVCPGTIDPKTSKFDVNFIPRPSLSVLDSTTMKKKSDKHLVKNGVCENYQDSAEIAFNGQPPFHLEYKVHAFPEHGSRSIGPLQTQDISSHVASIKMDTSQPGTYQYKLTKIGDRAYDSTTSADLPMIEQRVHSLPTAKFVDAGRTYNYCRDQSAAPDTIPIVFTGTPPFKLDVAFKYSFHQMPEVLTIHRIDTRKYDLKLPDRPLSLGSHTIFIRSIRDANGCETIGDLKDPHVRVNVVDMPTISPMESQLDYCVGDRISFALAGTPPFNVYYTFQGAERKATSSSTTFRRLAERPGDFVVTALSDKASTESCRARQELTKIIHPLPSVRISKGKVSEVDIHEGGEAELQFEFGGTPPFEFTYTRSTNAAKGKRSVVLETKSDISEEHTKIIRVSDEGTYEVVSIRDRYCSVTAQGVQNRKGSQGLLGF